MKEVVPQLIADMRLSEDSIGVKRSLESPGDVSEPPTSRAKTESGASEVLFAQHLTTQSGDIEVLIAEYIKKKMSKELPHSNNPPELQRMIDEGKRAEWHAISSKPKVVKLHFGSQGDP